MGVIDGRIAIITGGARGIGASVSRLFAREGASLVINDLGGAPDGSGGDEGPAKQIADEIAAAGGTAIADGGDGTAPTAGLQIFRSNESLPTRPANREPSASRTWWTGRSST